MSKEIAQTVGGKKFGYLVGLLAAFAVLATLGYQWNGAKANVSSGNATVAGPFTSNTGTDPVTSPTAVGTTVFYRVETVAAGLSAGYSNPVSVTFTFPTGITPAAAGTTVNGVAPSSCAAPAGQSVTCTWNSLNSGSLFSVAFQGTTSANAAVAAGTTVALGTCPPTQACATINDASASGPATLANNALNADTTTGTSALEIIGVTGTTLAKSSTTLSASGGSTSQVITFTNTAPASATTALTIKDVVPAGITVTSITAGGTGTVALASPNCGQSLTVAGPVTIVCTFTITTLTADQTATLTLGETAAANTSTSAAVVLTDNASASATIGGVTIAPTTTGSVTVGALGVGALTKTNTTASGTGTAETLPTTGGNFTSNITFTNNSATASTSGDIVLQDSIPYAGITIPAQVPANSGTSGQTLTPATDCSSANPAGYPTVQITTTATTTLTCMFSGAVAPGATTVWQINGTVPATPAGATITDTTSVNNTGLDQTCTGATVDIGGVCVAVDPVSATITVGTLSNVEVKHVNEAGNIVAIQDVLNNVRGARHTACLFTDSTASPETAVAGATGTYTPFNLGTALTPANIILDNGGYYQTPGDQSPTFTDPQFFLGTTGQSTGATCFSWTSSGAGDQEISVVVPVGTTTTTLDWDTDRDATAGTESGSTGGIGGQPALNNFSLVKEWNVLQTSQVSENGVALTPTAGGTVISGATACVTTGTTLVTVTNGALFAVGQAITITGTAAGTVNSASQTVTVQNINGNSLTVNALSTLNTACGLAISTGGTPANLTYNVSTGVVLNPNSQLNQLTTPSGLTFSDIFLGSHTTRTGAYTTQSLVGVPWTVSLAGCGALSGTLSGTTTLNTDGTVGNTPSVVFDAGGAANTNCAPGSTATITFTGSEPGVLASGPGNTVIETVNITFTQTLAVKQVLLAWAGQRIMLEHDWRIGPGDTLAGGPAGTCPFPTGADIIYAKSAEGPGSFVQALGATTPTSLGTNPVGYQPDAIDVSLTGDASQVAPGANQPTGTGVGDAPLRPQDACISRAIYESEDQGEVDISAFVNTTSPFANSASKWDVVIYYMKLNTVTLSAVSQDTNIYHNATNADFGPGNPWDATKDAASPVSWNVSTDLLMRGRVTGWFTNSNPSGRAEDTSNPQNVLPADRWVMPDDWANIAGGAALASTFRPSYDLMFAPNNAVGLALSSPSGTGGVVGTEVALIKTGSGTGSATSPILLTSTSFLGCTATASAPCVSPVSFYIGSTLVTGGSATLYVSATTGTKFVILAPAFGTAPVAGTPVFLSVSGSVPFVGPYSLIDIPGFAGTPGAALNNGGNGVSNVPLYRDTVQGDGVVNMWDAPMPPSKVSLSIRGTGLIRQVLKDNVYYTGTPGSPTTQFYPDPYYYQNIPESPYLAPIAIDGGYMWNSWGNDGPDTTGSACITSTYNPCSGGQGPYHFWQAMNTANNGEGANAYGVSDSSVAPIDIAQLAQIRTIFGDSSMSRDFVVYSDNHGELMFTAFGDFKTDLSACATNVLGGGPQCKPGDAVGTGTITAVADYPDFQKHFPVASNAFTVNWTWGGYKDVTVENGPTDQFKYVVFHAMDRDGVCDPSLLGAISLHPVLSNPQASGAAGPATDTWSYSAGGTTVTNPPETVDFLIDSGSGVIIGTSGSTGAVVGSTNGTGIHTFSTADNTAAGTPIKQFPLSPLAQSGATDECQAWVEVSNSLLGQTNVLAIAHDDEGNIGFDKVVGFQTTMSYTLNFRWTLITWNGADNIPVASALTGGTGVTLNSQGNDISSQVTAVYGWDAPSQTWLAYFPSGVNVPGANNLTALKLGSAYWIAITGPGPVTWTVTTNVS